MTLKSARLTLRRWRETDRETFAALNADPEVTWELGGPLDRSQSDAKFDRYVATFEQHGYCRWAIEDLQQHFLGYAGVMPSPSGHSLGPHAEIGWRLAAPYWNQGLATEGARAALRFGFDELGHREIIAYTAVANIRSRRVMEKLGMTYNPANDFDHRVFLILGQ